MRSADSLTSRLFGLMNIAAYVTWAMVLVLLVDSPASDFPYSRAAAVLSLCGFLVAFVLNSLFDDRGRFAWSFTVAEGVCALLTCVFWNDTLAPILIVVFMAGCGMRLGVKGLLLVGIGVNVLVWWIATALWSFNGAWRLMVAFVGFQMFATLTAWYARRATETSEALREAHAHLLATRSLLEESARDHERLRLARELHDVAGHKLTALKLNLTALQRNGSNPAAVDVSAQLATELLADIRGVVAQIRQHDGLDVRAALAQLIAPLPQPPRIHLQIDADARPDNVAQAETVLRVVQEAITNVVRHASAQNAWVEMRRDGASLRLQVRDDGRAELPFREGFGISGMRERLAPLGASLDFSRHPQGGLALDVRLPLNP